jgi:hypothetical protein
MKQGPSWKLIFAQIVKKLPNFMETESSVPYSQESAALFQTDCSRMIPAKMLRVPYALPLSFQLLLQWKLQQKCAVWVHDFYESVED